MTSAKRSAAAAPRASHSRRRRRDSKETLAAAKQARTKPKSGRYRPPAWTAKNAEELDLLIKAEYVDSRHYRIPAGKRIPFVKHASEILAAEIQAVRRSSAVPDYRRVRLDLAIMKRACARLSELGRKGENLLWIWAACNPRRQDDPQAIRPKVSRFSAKTKDGMLDYSREETAVVPASREEWLLHPSYLLTHDLRRLSLALDNAEQLLRNVRPSKTQLLGGMLHLLYIAYRRDINRRPTIGGPFGFVARFACQRVYGECLGERVLADELNVLHKVWTFHEHRRDSTDNE